MRFYSNPRKEHAQNTLRIRNRKFLELGLNPTTLDEGLLNEIVKIAERHKHRCDRSKILATSRWTRKQRIDLQGSRTPQGSEDHGKASSEGSRTPQGGEEHRKAASG